MLIADPAIGSGSADPGTGFTGSLLFKSIGGIKTSLYSDYKKGPQREPSIEGKLKTLINKLF
jgi:hypothetical protein